jgi:Nucleoside-diphosphate-sugar epimerases
MKKFLLIGGLGFVGKNVSLHLLKQGHEITIFDIKEPTQQDIDDFNSDAVKFLNGDVTNKNDLNLAFEDDYDGVFT